MINIIIIGGLFVTFCGAVEKCDMGGIEDTLCSLCDQRRGSSYHSELEMQLRENSAKIAEIQSKLQTRDETVAFYAYSGQNIPISSIKVNQPLVYDLVELNLGNGYDNKTGKFTAPSDGIYVFNIVTASYDKSWSTVQLLHNDIIKDVGFADSGDHNDRDTTTTVTIISVKQGEVLYTRVDTKGGSYLESGRYARNSFSAFKIN